MKITDKLLYYLRDKDSLHYCDHFDFVNPFYTEFYDIYDDVIILKSHTF